MHHATVLNARVNTKALPSSMRSSVACKNHTMLAGPAHQGCSLSTWMHLRPHMAALCALVKLPHTTPGVCSSARYLGVVGGEERSAGLLARRRDEQSGSFLRMHVALGSKDTQAGTVHTHPPRAYSSEVTHDSNMRMACRSGGVRQNSEEGTASSR